MIHQKMIPEETEVRPPFLFFCNPYSAGVLEHDAVLTAVSLIIFGKTY